MQSKDRIRKMFIPYTGRPYCVFFKNFRKIATSPSPIGCTKNYQSIGVTVNSHCVESFEGRLQRCRWGRGCSELWKSTIFPGHPVLKYSVKVSRSIIDASLQLVLRFVTLEIYSESWTWPNYSSLVTIDLKLLVFNISIKSVGKIQIFIFWLSCGYGFTQPQIIFTRPSDNIFMANDKQKSHFKHMPIFLFHSRMFRQKSFKQYNDNG